MNVEILNVAMLYVEDDKDTRERLTEVFQHKINNLYVAQDGVEALEIFKNNKIHFIISDYQMPNMNGNKLCAEVKKIDPNVCFTLLTAYNDSTLLIDAIDSGVDKFLQKPINSIKLFKILDDINQKIIDRYQLEKSSVCLQEAEKIALLSYWDVNLKTKCINFSQEAKELFCVPNTEDDYNSFLKIVKDKDKNKFLDIFSKRIFEENSIDETISIKNTNGHYIYIHIVAKRWKSSVCGENHIIGLFQDVSHYEIQNRKLLKENQLDPMLNISNKKYIISELESLIISSKRYGHYLGIVFFDIDNFKHINDIYGHLVADDILRELTSIIKNNIRQSDLFGRWGGDEFVIVTQYNSPESTIKLTKKIRDKIQQHVCRDKIKVTISMGISFYEIGDNTSSLIQRADMKMLEAKKSGKNRYSY